MRVSYPRDERQERIGGDDVSLGRCAPPVICLDVEASEPLPHLLAPTGREARGWPAPSAAYLLVRLHGVPVATALVPVPPEGLQPGRLARQLWQQAGDALARHAREDGLPVPVGLDPEGCVAADVPLCARRRAETLAHAPHVTVVIATRERPYQLRRCLESVSRSDYPSFDVVVVDNAPETETTSRLVSSHPWPVPLRYVREDRRGLAAAHNRGILHSRGEILAFTDDDVEVDHNWLSALVGGFGAGTGIVAVTGLIHPAELRTRAQILLEQHAGFGKGFVPTVYDLREHRPDDPLYPFAAGRLGSGANMAFDAEVLRRMGGFDPAMGTGTAAGGGDDLVALFSVIARGYRLYYEPAAVVFHYHRADASALVRQSFGYGVGLGAYLTNVMVHHPLMALETIARSPGAVARAVRPGSGRNGYRYEGWPEGMARSEIRGLLRGPAAYARSRWRSHGAERVGSDR